MALTQESILSFLLARGGKVKNSELLASFRSHISCSDAAEKQHNRDLFKRLVNSVAVVKQIDGVKFVVVKKKYWDFVQQEAQTHQSFCSSSSSTSFSYTSPHRAEAARMMRSDIENNNNNNTDCLPNMNCNYHSDAKHMPGGRVQGGEALSRNVSSVDTNTVKVLNISADHESRAGRSGSVFAVIAVKSPQRDSAPAAQHKSLARVPGQETSDKTAAMRAAVSVPPAQTRNTTSAACRRDATSEVQCRRARQMEDVQAAGFPQLRHPNKNTRQADDAKYTESVPLEPLTHEWLVNCAAGLWGQIYVLLLQDTRLVQKKDFLSGFTALHWAAKDGNSEMIRKLMDIATKRGTCVNVDSKAHGGYTPLHIAAIHGRTEVMALLVKRYGASVHERDNAGKKAIHYLGKGASAETSGLLGGLQEDKSREKTEDSENREHPKSLNTISKLFQPHIGKKHKTATKIAPDW